jgi:hypothetical protein
MSEDIIGRQVKDKITGFAGIVTGFVKYISGCNQALVVAKTGKDGEEKSHWFDVQRLDVQRAPRIVLNNAATPGPDMEAPKR